MNEGFAKGFYTKGNSVKRFGPFTEPLDSETESCCPHPLLENQLLNYAGSELPQGPFSENNLFALKVGLRWVFVNGLKWVQKWVFGYKNG